MPRQLLPDGLGAVGGEQVPGDPGRDVPRDERSEEGIITGAGGVVGTGRGRRPVLLFGWILVP
jgi:hypothetical protein